MRLSESGTIEYTVDGKSYGQTFSMPTINSGTGTDWASLLNKVVDAYGSISVAKAQAKYGNSYAQGAALPPIFPPVSAGFALSPTILLLGAAGVLGIILLTGKKK
jgi:hypothetical protein